MPNVGDGTGTKQSAPTDQGLTSNQSKRPQSVPSPLGSGDGGVGPDLVSQGNRTTPIKSGSSGSST
jgi:hypothetical protein